MICPRCGTQNPDYAAFCTNCGYRQESAAGQPAPSLNPAPGAYPTSGSYPDVGRESVPDYLGWAIAATILGFWPTGIVAIVAASRANSLKLTGAYEEARRSAHKAKVWSWVSVGISIGVLSLCVLIAVAATIAGSRQY